MEKKEKINSVSLEKSVETKRQGVHIEKVKWLGDNSSETNEEG